jgi:hypothetical protein
MKPDDIPSESTTKVCFIAMPYGRDKADHEELSAWCAQVITAAVQNAGYQPHLAVAHDAPAAITEEILRHLASDALAIFDLVGLRGDDPPNPNVMYELGIRHAFDSPAIIIASKKENLPFDIRPQRAILCGKTFAEVQGTRERLGAFITSAEKGDYYRPMTGVRRAERIQGAAQSTPEVLKDISAALVDIKSEVQTLRSEQRHLGHFGSLGELTRQAIESDLADTSLPLRALRAMRDRQRSDK